MPSVITGQRATAGASQAIQQAKRIVEMHPVIMELEDFSASPLTIFSMMVNKQAVGNAEYKVLEDELIPRIDRVNNASGYADSATSIVVDNGSYFHDNSLFRVQRTGEVIKVGTVSGNTLTNCTRSWGSTPAAALVDNDQITILPYVNAEGADVGEAKSTTAEVVTNYLQIVRWPFAITRSAEKSNLYGGSDYDLQRRKALGQLLVLNEHNFLFGEKNEDLSGATAVRSTGGIDEFISTNSRDFGGTFSLTTFYDFAEDLFRYGSKDKTAFISRGLATNIALEAQGMVEKQESDESMGMSISRLVTPHGRLRLITHDLLEGDTYGGYGLIVDLDKVGYRYLKDSDISLYTDRQNPGVDGKLEEYLGEVGFWSSIEKAHGRITNAA